MQFLKLFIYETIFYSLIQEYISLGEAIFLKGLWYSSNLSFWSGSLHRHSNTLKYG